MYVKYKNIRFKTRSLELLNHCLVIIEQFKTLGYKLTVRQLYYQLVGKGILNTEGNNEQSYKMIVRLIKNAREAGLIDWQVIEDRTRNLKGNIHWSTPKEALQFILKSYNIDLWQNQKYRLEVWIEKDALVNVISKVCSTYDVPFFSCRGFSSASEIWQAGYIRFKQYIEKDKQMPVILHLSDLDPSGIAMTKDIKDRINLYSTYDIKVLRLGLSYEQIQQYNLPPNYAKFSDTRYNDFVEKYGKYSYELDALAPNVIADLVETSIKQFIVTKRWSQMLVLKEQHIKKLTKLINEE